MLRTSLVGSCEVTIYSAPKRLSKLEGKTRRLLKVNIENG